MPGLDDNRSPEVDITNNIATTQLIKKLKTAKIVIVLSRYQFKPKMLNGLK
jgi:hypothetical protein